MLARFLASALGCLWRERRGDRRVLERARDRRLRALLRHARDRTELGRRRLEGIDLDGPLDLASIPPIGKVEMMTCFPSTIIDGALTFADVEAFAQDPGRVGQFFRGRYSVATTSGTTGQVGFFVTDREAWAAINGALFARILRHRLIPREIARFCYGRRYRMAMTVATNGHFITRLISTFRPLLTRALVNLRAFSIMEPTSTVVADLNRFRPHYLHSYPTFLEALAHEQLQGRLDIMPEFISLGSEPVSMSARSALRRAFPSAEISETYGATECLVIANQCRHGGLHVNEDLCVLEPVDAEGRPVPVGAPSERVLLTNLINRAQPLIRYELLDSVTVLPEPCPCGSVMQRITVEGRSDDTFFLSDGVGIFHAYPPVPFETLFLDLAGLAQYQLVHERQNHLRVRFVPQRGADVGVLRERLEERFRAHFARNDLEECVHLEIEPVSRLEREAAGQKLRQVYSKVPRPALAL